MIWILATVLIVAIAMFLLARQSEKGKPPQTGLPYQRAEVLFSPAERSFIGVLQQAVGSNAAIFGKVRVADVVAPKEGLGRSARQKAFNQISSKHFDFLLCDKEDLSVACVIELDDGSHHSRRRQEGGDFLKRVCEAAGIPLIHVPAESAYVVSAVIQLLPRYLTIKTTPDQEPSPAPPRPKSEFSGKVCPSCSAPMVKRVARNGKHAGKHFWACSAYPKCRTIEAISAQ